ncbi:MAG: efflux RND transporter periplasmic adaptor subunit [Alphaproteobacteria bacterium]|nr:efflux RND transporter periplasmic adaptor subunit [Alphaproteobacteria bacterium]
MAIIAARFPSPPFLSLAAGLAFLALWPSGAEAQRPSPVRVDKVVMQPLVETAPVFGRLVSRMRGAVAAQTEGAVTEMRVQVGDRVAAGDVLAVLDIEKLASERDARAATADAVAARAVAAGARLERVEQEIARYEKLRRSAAFSKARLQDKEQERAWLRSELDAARAQLVQARAGLALADMNLSRGTVRAPYDGVVTALHTEIGSYLKEGGAVLALVNDRKLEIEADVPAARIAGLAPGAEVAVLLPDGTKHRARVRAVVCPAPVSSLFMDVDALMEAGLPNPAGRLAPDPPAVPHSTPSPSPPPAPPDPRPLPTTAGGRHAGTTVEPSADGAQCGQTSREPPGHGLNP